jgi:hypothetical protein
MTVIHEPTSHNINADIRNSDTLMMQVRKISGRGKCRISILTD